MDIRKYTGMVVLASIPLADAGEQPKEKSEFKRRTKRFANDVRRRVGGSSGREKHETAEDHKISGSGLCGK